MKKRHEFSRKIGILFTKRGLLSVGEWFNRLKKYFLGTNKRVGERGLLTKSDNGNRVKNSQILFGFDWAKASDKNVIVLIARSGGKNTILKELINDRSN